MANVVPGIVYNINLYINPDLVARILFNDNFGMEIRPYTRGLMSTTRKISVDKKLSILYTLGFDALINSLEGEFGIRQSSFLRHQIIKGSFVTEPKRPKIIEAQVQAIAHSSLYNDISSQYDFPVTVNRIGLTLFAGLAIMLDTDENMKMAPQNLRGSEDGWGILTAFSLVVGTVVA